MNSQDLINEISKIDGAWRVSASSSHPNDIEIMYSDALPSPPRITLDVPSNISITFVPIAENVIRELQVEQESLQKWIQCQVNKQDEYKKKLSLYKEALEISPENAKILFESQLNALSREIQNHEKVLSTEKIQLDIDTAKYIESVKDLNEAKNTYNEIKDIINQVLDTK